MSVPFDELVSLIEKRFPLTCAYEWDNSGVQVKLSDDISGVLVTLDLTPGAVDEAVSKGCNFILTHHPPIFRAIKGLSCDDPATGALIKAIRQGINVYSAHTSCDCAPEGLNFELAEKLGLKNTRVFANDGCAFPGGGIGAAGCFAEPLSETEIAALVKEKLGAKAVRCSNVRGRFQTAAAVGGAGGDLYREALRQDIRVLITGEAKHNEFVEASACGVLLLAAGHYETERLFSDLAVRALKTDAADKKIQLKIIAAQEKEVSSSVL